MQKNKIKKMYIKKIDELKKYDKAYFEDNNPLISDGDYDNVKQEILDLERKYKYLNHGDSLSHKIGYKPSDRFRKVNHNIPMLSLSNAFSRDDIVDFIKKLVIF